MLIIADKKKKGTIKFFNQEKGYGFIKSEGTEIFVNATGLIDKVKDKDQVIFTLTKNKKGLCATEVKIDN